MRPQKVDDQALMEGLMAVLREKGFDGASLNDMAEATGLKKASLYHRFPGGKKEITQKVLDYVNTWNEAHIEKVLKAKNIKPKERLEQVIDNIRALYDNGDSMCLFRALTMETSANLFGLQIEEGFNLWRDSFTQLGEDLGFDKSLAKRMAIEVLISIQGSLVVAKGLNDLAPFQQALNSIKHLYIK